MKKRIGIALGILLIGFSVFAQNTRRVIPGQIESYIDRFEEGKVDKNKNGWAYYYIPKGMADTLTVKMSCVYEGHATHAPHIHNEDEAFYIVKGPVNFHVNGEEQILNSGDFIYTPSGSSHNIQRVGNDTIKYLVIKREALKSLDTPYSVGKTDYTIADCAVFPSQNPIWAAGENARIKLLDPIFSDGFQVTIIRALHDNLIVLEEDKSHHSVQKALYILSGEAVITLDGQQTVIRENNTFYCPKGDTYTIHKTSESNAPLVFLVISAELS